ncbi:probable cytokinin riboside 5'-monophosphate phosphoribohydrolase LOG6 [Andrographis paniculata]|uniref:probable cytokinin riboside 5'-monophosphate phosphoribohydrolase LOG6 n=1 Tax=Andrographis paniculata TaxID=175694 RepID=UPI0021E85ECA|nr:probable cytokinin riboside 5'-monophosphate phosphoribohydrolase LOG6 [Andrographis paniculata]
MEISNKFKRVCVFCGSSAGKKDCYTQAAIDLGRHLAAKKLDLVYGGGSIGLMGLVAQSVRDAGGNVLGIIPKPLLGKEKTGETIGELRIVGDMHQRKAEMSRNSDCYIALPGGYGTLEELLEVITWAQLGIHTKPVGLLNVGGFFDGLLRFVEGAVEEGFITPIERHIFVSAPNAADLLLKLHEYAPVVASKLKWDDAAAEVLVVPIEHIPAAPPIEHIPAAPPIEHIPAAPPTSSNPQDDDSDASANPNNS